MDRSLRTRCPRRAALAVLAAYAVCAGAGAAFAEGDDYYPVADGTRWEYAVRYETPDHPGIPTRTGTRLDRIDGREEHNGRTYLRFSSTLEGIGTSPVTGHSLMRPDSSGIHFRVDLETAETLSLPLPPVVGHTWSWHDDWGDWKGTIQKELPVETPAGRFESCVEVSVEQVMSSDAKRGHMGQVSTYCRGVGPVRRVTETETPGPHGPVRGLTEETLTRTSRRAPTR